MLAEEDVSLAGVAVGGEIRSSAIVLERSGRVTVMNEPGPPVRPEDWERYESAIAERIGEHDVLGVQREPAARRAARRLRPPGVHRGRARARSRSST